MRNDTKSVKLIAKLLRQTSSLTIVSEFLKVKGLTHSASSWDDMVDKRLVPAIKAKKILIQDLIELLRNVENTVVSMCSYIAAPNQMLPPLWGGNVLIRL
jgi:hypothetical protein